MTSQQLSITDVMDERTAQLYVDHLVLTAFCRVLDASRLPPHEIMRIIAAALGSAYRNVALAHDNGRCPCGWLPKPERDLAAMTNALESAAAPEQGIDLRSMVIAGRA